MTLSSRLHGLRQWSLTAQLAAIVVVVLLLDFGSNAYLSHRTSNFILPPAEAAHLAQRLDHAARTIEATPPNERADVARRLGDTTLELHWTRQRETPSGIVLAGLHQQLLQEQDHLGWLHLQLQLSPLNPSNGIRGAMTLPDHSGLLFHSHTRSAWPLLLGQLLDLLLPTLAFVPLTGALVFAALRPLRRLVRASRIVGTPRARPLDEIGPSEVRVLIRAFNSMQRRIDSLFDANVQTLLAIGHDLRTPLARLRLRLDSMALSPDEADALEADIAEMGDLLGSLQAYLEGENSAGRREPFDLAAMAQTLVDQSAELGGDASYSGPDHAVLHADPVAMRRALANVIDNALHYGGNAHVTLSQDAGGVAIVVTDNGPGIPEEKLDKVLQPFVRLDQARERKTKGMGLGLAIVERALASTGGYLALANRATGGIKATLFVPALPRDEA
jgi:signal transduction histidine kinase